MRETSVRISAEVGRCAITTLPRSGRVCERCTPTLRCGARLALERRRSSLDEVIELVVEPAPAREALPAKRRSSPGRHSAHRSQGTLPRVELGRLIRLGRSSADGLYCGLDGSIRRGGVFVATSAPREVGVEVELSFVAPGMTGPHTTVGRVAWIREDTRENVAAIPGMGIALGPLPASVERALERLLATSESIFYDSWAPEDSRP
jgi:Tfp pilus assembly protein PilZ